MKSSPLVLAGLLAASLSAAAEQKTSTTLIKAEHYAALKDVLVQGDTVFAFAVRDRDPSERASAPLPDRPVQPGGPGQVRQFRKTVWNDRKFTAQLEVLNAIHDARLEKMVVFSSFADFTTNLKRIPKDVRWIAYNNVDVQVVVGRGSKEDLIKGLQAVADDVNGRDLWTMQDTATAKEILKAIR